jgi:hypothetical protein
VRGSATMGALAMRLADQPQGYLLMASTT